MLRLFSILACFITGAVLGQPDTNQVNTDTMMFGKQVDYHDNGEIKEVRHYSPYERELSKEEAFFYAQSDLEPEVIHSQLLHTDRYFYDENWKLKRIERTDRANEVNYLYGPNQEISLKATNFYFINRVGNSQILSLEMRNNSGQAVALHMEFDSDNFSAENKEVVLQADTVTMVGFGFTFKPDNNQYLVTLKNQDIRVEYVVRTFAFHISSQDIRDKNELTLKRKFIYYRTGNEALLKIYDSDKERELKTVSLAKHQTQIDLKKLKAGRYWFCVVDFSSKAYPCCKVQIEK